MKSLGMPGGQFLVEIVARNDDSPSPDGLDEIDFLVSANPGQPPKPVAKVASGGELSRISLAVQVAAAHGVDGRVCMIFDEVDAGVGGAVAERVGRQLRALGQRGQVLCVTHLAQVASQADQQVRVAKLTDGRTSRTTLTALGPAERVPRAVGTYCTGTLDWSSVDARLFQMLGTWASRRTWACGRTMKLPKLIRLPVSSWNSLT